MPVNSKLKAKMFMRVTLGHKGQETGRHGSQDSTQQWHGGPVKDSSSTAAAKNKR